MHKNGYWAVLPDERSSNIFDKLCLALDYDPANNEHPYHCTLAYDDRNPEQTAEPDPTKVFKAQISGFALFGEDKDVLVALIHSPELQEEHKRIHQDGTMHYDFPEYNAHVTLVETGATEDMLEYMIDMAAVPIPVEFSGEYTETLED